MMQTHLEHSRGRFSLGIDVVLVLPTRFLSLYERILGVAALRMKLAAIF